VAALREEMLRVSLLEIAAADFIARNLRGDRKDGYAAAVAIVKTVDQMQVARSTASRAHGQASGQMRVGPCREGRSLLVSHGNPMEIVPRTDRVGDAIEGISRETVDFVHAGGHQGVDEQFCHIPGFHFWCPTGWLNGFFGCMTIYRLPAQPAAHFSAIATMHSTALQTYGLSGQLKIPGPSRLMLGG
jgi:hypothetical protein